jgi:hypothetical protein
MELLMKKRQEAQQKYINGEMQQMEQATANMRMVEDDGQGFGFALFSMF